MSAVKALQQWCKIQCKGYRDVSITNMTTSFRDGLAFCAIIHKHRPELITFDSLKKEDVFENNKLAFGVAEKLGIPALLDAEDMVALRVPDRLSILTYVSQYYNYFHGRSPIGGLAGAKRPAEVSENEPSGKKNSPVTAKSFPASKPALGNHPPVPPSSSVSVQLDQKVEVRGGPTGTLSNTCVTCHKRVHLVERHLVDGKLYHRSCAKSTLKENAPLRDLLQKASSTKQKPPSVTPEPSQPTSGLYSSDSSWLTTKKPPTSTPSHAPSWSTTKKQPTSSPSPAPSWSANKTQRSSSPSPVPSGLTTKKPPSSSPSPAPTWSANKTHMFSSLSPAPSRLTNETQRSRSPSPSPSCATYKTHLSNSPSPAPSGLANQTQRSSSPSPAPSGLANKTQRSSSPSPAPSLNTYEIHVSSSPSHTLSGLANKTQQSGSANPAPSGLTNQTVGTVPASTSGQTLISTSNKPRAQLFGSNTTSTTIKATLTTSPTTPLKVTTPTPTSNTIAIPTAHTSTSSPTIMVTPTPTPGKPTAAPRTSLATQRTQEAKLKFLQGNSEGTTVVGKDLRSATKGGPPGSFPRSGLTASAQGARGGAGGASKAVSVSKNQAAELISRKLAKEGHGDDPEITRKTDGVPVTETPRRGRVKLKVDRSLLADLQTPGVDPSPNRTGSASSPPPRQASSAPDKGRGPAGAGHVLDNKQHLKQLREIKKAAEGPEPSGDPAHWRSKLKPVAQNTKTSDPKSSPPGRKSPAPEICVGQVSKTPPGHQPAARPPTSGFLNGERPSGDVGTKPEPQPSKTKPHHIPKEKILEELQEIEVQLNQLETRGVELEKRLRRSEEDGEEDAAMDEVMVDWFDLITEKQMAMRRESELVYLAKAQDLEEQQPSVEQELRRLMEKPEHAKTWQERQREKELTDKLVEIVNDRNAIVDGLDEDRLREGEEDEQLQQLKMSLDIKKDKPKKKSPMSKLFGWGNNNNNNKS